MVQKPKIQYIGQFYVHGSEARELAQEKAQKKARTSLPLERLRKIEKITVDPVACVAILVAVVMLATMLVGALQIRNDWADYRAAANYAASLRAQKAQLTRDYRSGYNLDEIRSKALGLGLVPVSEAASMTVRVTLPEPEAELTWQEEVKMFWDGLWA